jgi:hypothetical protein
MGLVDSLLGGNLSAVLMGSVAVIVFLATIRTIPWRCSQVKTRTDTLSRRNT